MEAIIYMGILTLMVIVAIIYSRWESRHATRKCKKYTTKK